MPLLDLFATRWNHKLPLFVFPVPDLSAMAVDALSMSWKALLAYAYPPPALLPRVLEKAQQDQCEPHCPTLAPGDLVPTPLRDVGTISTPDTQHSSVTIPALRSDPSRYVLSPATHVESIRDTLCSRDRSVDVASCVKIPQRESTLAIYESKWGIFTDWCNIQHINPLSATENVVSDIFLHLHTEKHLAI